MADLYAGRRLSEGYPDLQRLAFETFTRTLDAQAAPDAAGVARQLALLSRVVDLDGRKVLVVGCGPRPQMLKSLLQMGIDAIGVEPVKSFVHSTAEFLGRDDRVVVGSAERIPVMSDTQQLVYCNSVLEHVDSPLRSLEEMHRVLRPGGIAFVITTNRHRVSLTGENGEFNVPYFNWLPATVKESFTFRHLHYEPELANYTGRPAVHWYTFSELCNLGRSAGFTQFYSLIDLYREDDPSIRKSGLRRFCLRRLQASPWLRALALSVTYFGGMILMLKGRPAEQSG
jgi:ubiquinone/menaquinone biosynthesis C-methylase UbiE